MPRIYLQTWAVLLKNLMIFLQYVGAGLPQTSQMRKDHETALAPLYCVIKLCIGFFWI